MAIKPNYTPHVKPSVASAISDLQSCDSSMWTTPVQDGDQVRALKILGFSWDKLRPIIYPVFPKSPDKRDIIAAAQEVQSKGLAMLRLLDDAKKSHAPIKH